MQITLGLIGYVPRLNEDLPSLSFSPSALRRPKSTEQRGVLCNPSRRGKGKRRYTNILSVPLSNPCRPQDRERSCTFRQTSPPVPLWVSDSDEILMQIKALMLMWRLLLGTFSPLAAQKDDTKDEQQQQMDFQYHCHWQSLTIVQSSFDHMTYYRDVAETHYCSETTPTL